MSIRLLVFLLVILALGGCSRFAFYGDSELKGAETGVKFYTPKPYLLVARTGNKDKPTEISVIYIPDLSKPLYALPKSGIGSSNLTLSLANGVLTTMGQQTDAKIPELITAVAGLGTSVATARKTFKETSLLQPQAAPDYVKLSSDLKTIAQGVDTELKRPETPDILTPLERQTGSSIVTSLLSASALLSDPTKAEMSVPAVVVNLKAVLDNWQKQIKAPSTATAGPEPAIRRQLTVLQDQVKGVLAKLLPEPAEELTFSLYEIDNSSSTGTILREVKF